MSTRRLTDEERRQRSEARVAALRALAADAANQLGAALPLRSFLDCANQHPLFSVPNVLLIAVQRSSAVELRHFSSWRASGRQVVRGERGVRLLYSPGGGRTERVVSLFDVAQTITLPHDTGQFRTYVAPGDRIPFVRSVGEVMDQVVMLARQLDGVPDDTRVRELLALVATWIMLGQERVPMSDQVIHDLQALSPDLRQWTASAAVQIAGRIRRALHVSATLESSATDIVGRVRSGVAIAATLRRDAEQGPSEAVTRVTSVDSRSGARVVNQKHDSSKRTQIADVNRAAMAFFVDRLTSTPRAVEYLRARVGATEFDQFCLGYAPPEAFVLVDHLRKIGYDDDLLLAAGLVRSTDDGQLRDVFRDRLLFGLHDGLGSIVGFIGRRTSVTDPNWDRKYLNTRTTALFSKGRTVFGLYEQRAALAAGALPVVVEGPLDVLAIAARRNSDVAALCACGTAVTDDHLVAIEQATASPRMMLLLDSDVGGLAATERLARRLQDRASFRAEISRVLPDGHDPASWLSSGGRFDSLLVDSVPSALWLCRRIADRLEHEEHPEWVERKVAALHEMASVLGALPPVESAPYAAEMADRLGLPASTVAAAVLVERTSGSHNSGR